MFGSTNSPNGYRYIGYNGLTASEKYGATISSLGGGSLNLFTQDLTLSTSRTHNLDGNLFTFENGRTILKNIFPNNIVSFEDENYGYYIGTTPPPGGKSSRMELAYNAGVLNFIATGGTNFVTPYVQLNSPNGNGNDKVLIIRNHTNTQNLFSVGNGSGFYGGVTIGNFSDFSTWTRVQANNYAYLYLQTASQNVTVSLYNEGLALVGTYFNHKFMFMNSNNGGGVIGTVDGGNGRWFINKPGHYFWGDESNIRFNIMSTDVTESSGDIFNLKHSNNDYSILFNSFRVTNDGYIKSRINTSAISDARLENSQFSFSIDEGTDTVTMKIKKSNGTVITKTI